MKTLLLVLMGSVLLGACGRNEDGKPQSAAQAGSFFFLPGGDVKGGN